MLGLLSIQKPPKVSGLDINATEPAVIVTSSDS